MPDATSTSFFDPGSFSSGGLCDFQSDQSDFRVANRSARDASVAGNTTRAQVMYQRALAIYNSQPDVDPGRAELAYTEQVLGGDAQARADAAAGTDLLARGQANQPGILSKAFGNAATGSIASAWETSASWVQGFLGYGQPQSGKQTVYMKKGADARKWGLPILGLAVVAYIAAKAGAFKFRGRK